MKCATLQCAQSLPQPLLLQSSVETRQGGSTPDKLPTNVAHMQLIYDDGFLRTIEAKAAWEAILRIGALHILS